MSPHTFPGRPPVGLPPYPTHGLLRDPWAGVPSIGPARGATAGEGTQNLMCAAQAAEVLLALVVVAVWPGGWPIDPIIAPGVAGWAVWEGKQSWRGADCC